jgi:hypothetical protein
MKIKFKVCNDCGESKPLTEFSKKGMNKDGSQKYQPNCKDCVNKHDKERRETDEYKEYRKVHGVEYRKENKEILATKRKNKRQLKKSLEPVVEPPLLSETRKCKGCDETMSLSLFRTNGKDENGNIRYLRYCKECYKKRFN